MELSNLPHKEFKVIITKMLTELGRRINEFSGNFNRVVENIKKCQTKVITEVKIILKSEDTLWTSGTTSGRMIFTS